MSNFLLFLGLLATLAGIDVRAIGVYTIEVERDRVRAGTAQVTGSGTTIPDQRVGCAIRQVASVILICCGPGAILAIIVVVSKIGVVTLLAVTWVSTLFGAGEGAVVQDLLASRFVLAMTSYSTSFFCCPTAVPVCPAVQTERGIIFTKINLICPQRDCSQHDRECDDNRQCQFHISLDHQTEKLLFNNLLNWKFDFM